MRRTMRRTKTHFEQIPVEVVKKIADIQIPPERTKGMQPETNLSTERTILRQGKQALALQEESHMMKPPAEPEFIYPEWQKPYLAALIAVPAELQERVTEAETAIFNRLQAISQSPDHEQERLALSDAMRSLRIVKKTKLDYPDWGTTG